MSLLQPSAAAAVVPLKSPPASPRDWASLGLPATGWLLMKDRALCEDCPGYGTYPCVGACISDHRLPEDGRRAMGTCAQCDPAPCAEACPADAVVQTAQGVVEVDQEICIGCRFCEDACPNDALLFIDPYLTPVPDQAIPGYSAGQPTGQLPNTVAKCTLCSDHLLQGEMPVCAGACALGAIWVGNLDRNTATNGGKVIRLSDLLERNRFEVVRPGNRIVDLIG